MPERIEKPWGYEWIWARTNRYLGKVIHVRAGSRLSLQYHERKDETLLVRSGTLILEVEEEGKMVSRRLGPGDTYRVRPRQKHRPSAETDVEIWEVSSPEADDVVRLEDDFGRAAPSGSG